MHVVLLFEIRTGFYFILFFFKEKTSLHFTTRYVSVFRSRDAHLSVFLVLCIHLDVLFVHQECSVISGDMEASSVSGVDLDLTVGILTSSPVANLGTSQSLLSRQGPHTVGVFFRDSDGLFPTTKKIKCVWRSIFGVSAPLRGGCRAEMITGCSCRSRFFTPLIPSWQP